MKNREAWLAELTPREIVWLMLELKERPRYGSWFTPDTAQVRIRMLREELRDRRRQAMAGAAA